MDLTADQLRVLELFRPGLWHIPTAAADSVACGDLHAAGLLERRRQARKGFPALYRITDKGRAALPVDAPPRPPVPDRLY